MPERYITGELPVIGDVVKGKPNNVRSYFAGIVAATYEGSVSLLIIHPETGTASRLYGEAINFELLARN